MGAQRATFTVLFTGCRGEFSKVFLFFLEVYSMFPEWEVLFRNVRGPAR